MVKGSSVPQYKCPNVIPSEICSCLDWGKSSTLATLARLKAGVRIENIFAQAPLTAYVVGVRNYAHGACGMGTEPNSPVVDVETIFGSKAPFQSSIPPSLYMVASKPIDVSTTGAKEVIISTAAYNGTSMDLVATCQGLVLNLHVDEPKDATSFKDVSPFRNHAQCEGNCPISGESGKFGKALTITAGRGFRMARNSSLTPTTVTVSLWMRSWMAGGYIVEYWNNPLLQATYGFYSDSNVVFLAATGSGTNHVDSAPIDSNLLSGNTWHHLVGTYDGSFLRIYLDGAEVASATEYAGGLVYDDSSDESIFEAARYGQNGGFSGTLDEIQIYNRALTAMEIQALYAETIARHSWEALANEFTQPFLLRRW